MSKWKTKIRKRLRGLSAIALAIAVCAGNFSGMTVQAESQYVEDEYEINFSRFDQIIWPDNVANADEIVISEKGYRLGDSEKWIEFSNLYIGGHKTIDEHGERTMNMNRCAPIIIDGVPEGATITVGHMQFFNMQSDIEDKSCLIVNESCKIEVVTAVHLWTNCASSINVKNGSTLTLSGKGDIFATQDLEQFDEEVLSKFPPVISGNGIGNLDTDNFTGHFQLDSMGVTFGDFANIDLNLELYPNSEYIRRGEFEICQRSSKPVFDNCGNVTLEAYCYAWTSSSAHTWIDASGDVKIVDNGAGFQIGGGYLGEEPYEGEPLIKAKNFTFIGRAVDGLNLGYNWEGSDLQQVAIRAEEKIDITGGQLYLHGQVVAPEIILNDNPIIDIETGDVPTFVGNVKINNATEAFFKKTVTDAEQQSDYIFAGDANIQVTTGVNFEGPHAEEADYFAKDMNISYEDGYLRVKTVRDNACATDRLEGKQVWGPWQHEDYDCNHRWILGKNALVTLSEKEPQNGYDYDSIVCFDVNEGEKLTDVLTMSEGAEIRNRGIIMIYAADVASIDQLIDLHPESTQYVRWYDEDEVRHACIYTANMAWDKQNPMKATWEYIATDKERVSEVQLFKDGEVCQLDGADSMIVSTNEFDFTSYMEKAGYGKYTFAVKPVLTEADGSAFSFETKSGVYTYQEENTGENNNNGSQENNNESQGDNNGSQGNNNGSQGGNNGSQGDNNGSQENNNGSQGDNNVSQGDNNGSQGGNNGNQGDPQPQEPDVNDDDEEDEVDEGTELEYEDAIYVVTKVGEHPTVSYQETLDNKAKTIKIPSTIKVEGVTYKVTGIEDNAFTNNKKITKVTIGDNVKTIGESAFSGCKNLKTVNLSKELTTIDDEAFYKCTSLTSITIPSKVNKIGEKAFYGCKKLKNITIKTKKLTSKNVGKKAFQGIVKKATIKVPSSKLNSYKKLLKAKGVSTKAKIKK